MLHKFFEEGHWFRPKRYGYGAGLPIAWQGWVLLGAFLLVVLGIAIWADDSTEPRVIALAALGIAIATGTFLAIVGKRTEGGLRWRWGRDR